MAGLRNDDESRRELDLFGSLRYWEESDLLDQRAQSQFNLL